jgi:nucleotide-binding universal stress UspA family protein
MKTILTPAAGSDSDIATFETALAAARPLGAHLEFLHIRISPSEAARFTPHLDFAPGAALHQALETLADADKARSAAAARHVRDFCRRHRIELGDGLAPQRGVSAAWREEADDAIGRLMRHARHNDLIVLGRVAHRDSLPDDLIEQLLVGCGRPVLLAAPTPRPRLLGTAMVCWQEAAQAARALGAALPLLAKSDRVLIARVDDGSSAPEDAVAIARYLAWHGIEAQTYTVPSDGRTVAELLGEAAATCEVDLIVMGGYSRSRTREHVFGGCTESFIERADRPVLLMH